MNVKLTRMDLALVETLIVVTLRVSKNVELPCLRLQKTLHLFDLEFEKMMMEETR
jgi:hypothetical protein